MNIKQALFAFLKKNKKTFNDIEFIISTTIADEDMWKKGFEISKEDFIELATDVPIHDLGFMKFVGKDFYITSETEHQYFELITIPQRPKKKLTMGTDVDVAKSLLLEEEDPAIRLGVKFNG